MERKSGQCDMPGYAVRMVIAASKQKELTDESGWFFFYVFSNWIFPTDRYAIGGKSRSFFRIAVADNYLVSW